MAKGRLIETITDRASGASVEIRLSRDTDQFTAEVEGKKLQAPSLPEIRKLIDQAIRSLMLIEWMPAIRVWLTDADSYGHRHYSGHQGTLFLAIERVWIARRSDSNLIESRWESADEGGQDMRRTRSRAIDRFTLPKDAPLALPLSTGEYSRGMLLPYDEALFAQLQAMAKGIGQIADGLYRLMLSTAGRSFLQYASPVDAEWLAAAAKVQAANASEGAGD